MKRSKRFLVFLLSVSVITAITMMPTLSWLFDKSQQVVNTFDGGKISIVLDEAPVDEYGKEIPGNRVTTNSYKYVAGVTLDKDPTPTVLQGSESSYVFIFVENGLSDKFTTNIDTDPTTAAWLPVASEGGNTLYIYKTKVDASKATQDIVLDPIFTEVKVADDLTQEDIANLGQRTLNTTAYAVQTAELTSHEAIDLAVAEFLPGATVTYVDIT